MPSKIKTLLLILLMAVAGFAADIDWPEETNTSKPWSRWWWMGSAVDKASIAANLELYSQAGIGGLEITCIYGVKGWEDKQISYLSDDWIDMLCFTSSQASSLGMAIDMPNGTGWPFGGPGVSKNDADTKLVLKKDDTSNTYSISEEFSGRHVKRPGLGGVGYAINPFSKIAVENYLSTFDKPFHGRSSKLIRAYFHDSFEYLGNWSDDLLEQFKKARGYDLNEYLDAFYGDSDEETVARVKCDYRQTLSEMLLENFTVTWTNWAHKNGALTRNQAHGSPANLLDLYASVDIPEIEIFGPSGFEIENLRTDENFTNTRIDPLMLKFASSAGNVAGVKLVSTESFTWLGEHFKVALSQVKPEFDQLICCGVNHIFYHGITYSPIEEAWPGWRFYASVEFGPTASFWEEMKYLNKYITRCQSVMQESEAANDVLLYWPIFDIWHDSKGFEKCFTVHNINNWLCNSSFYRLAKSLQQKGYCFDYVSDRQLRDHDLKNYKVIVIPECRFMPARTVERLKELASMGKTIIFEESFPTDVPGLAELSNRQAKLKRGLAELKVERNVFTGHINNILSNTKAVPETISQHGLRFIRKKHNLGYYYFVSNLTNKKFDNWLGISTVINSAIILEPLTGSVGKAAARKNEVYLQLEPGQSLILKTFTDINITASKWNYFKCSDKVYPLEGRWQVKFIKGRSKLPCDFETSELASWTDRDDAESFSGSALYKMTFELPDVKTDDWLLDLGKVCESAKVTINGQYVTTLWSLPFKMMVGRYLQPGENTIEIEVTSLDANAIAKMDRDKVGWKKFYDTNILSITYKPFDASGWEPTESGLIGPMKIIPAALLKL